MIKLLIFSASWCKHCGGIDKALKNIAPIEVIDADVSVEMTEKFDILSLPTIVVLKNGQEIHRFVGDTLVSKIEKYLNTL